MNILRAAVAEYIRTGEPVSSDELYRRYGFGVKPATIRNELAALTEKGFLAQPYTSGGRVPTDKGYMAFVEAAFGDFAREASNVLLREWDALEREFMRGDFEGLVGGIAETFSVLGVGYDARERIVHKRGLSELFHGLLAAGVTDDPREWEMIVRDFEELDGRVSAFAKGLRAGDTPVVFVGKSPLTRSRQLSVIVDRYAVDGEEVLLAAVGPKRMDYGRCIQFFRSLKDEVV